MSIILNGSTGITTPADTVTGNETVGGTLAVNGVSNALGTPGTSGNLLTSNGTAWVSSAPTGGVPTATAIGQVPFSTDGSTYTATQKITQGTAVASTSGTSVTFTGIPSWVKRIIVMLSGVSTNGSSLVQIQIGSTTFSTSGYTSSASFSNAGTCYITSTTGFALEPDAAGSSANTRSGVIVLYLITGNTWTSAGNITSSAQVSVMASAGNSPSLSGALDRVRITTVNGTDTFDAGTINIMYE